MKLFYIVAAVFTMLSPQNESLPKEFFQLPEAIRERATIVVSGTFGHGRTPCMIRSDGMRVWGLESWINVKLVYRGDVLSKSITIDAKLPTRE